MEEVLHYTEGSRNESFEKQTLNGTYKVRYVIQGDVLEQVVAEIYAPEHIGYLEMLEGRIDLSGIPSTTESYTEIVKDFQQIISAITVEEEVRVEYKIIKRNVDYGN